MADGPAESLAVAGSLQTALPPLDSSALEFDVTHELRRTMVDLIRNDEPTTILGLLLANPNGIGIEEIAKGLALAEGLVAWNIDKLEREDLCVRVETGSLVRVFPLAPYTRRNE